MIRINGLLSTTDAVEAVRAKCRARRLAMNLPQAELARRSGVSLGSLKRFERSGEISLQSLVGLAFALDCLAEFLELFPPVEARTLDDLTREPPRRARARPKTAP